MNETKPSYESGPPWKKEAIERFNRIFGIPKDKVEMIFMEGYCIGANAAAQYRK